jgi:type III protein arginine methyltransferase
MMDWSRDLSTALNAGDPAFMKAMLARVPQEVLQRAIPYLEALAKTSVAEGKLETALTYYNQLIQVAPGNTDWHLARAQVYFKLDQLPDAMADAKRIVELLPEHALGYRLQAEAHDGLRELPQAVAAYRQALRYEPDDDKSKQRIQFLETEIRKEALLKQTLNPSAEPPPQIETPPPPEVTFDPALFDDPSIPDTFEQPMVAGLKQLLWRYSGQQSIKNILSRLEDPVWLAAWDNALAATGGSKILFRGSELGTFALRALQHGATYSLAVEPFPLDGRIASGLVQKHFLAAWHAQHGTAIQSWTEEERRALFEAFTQHVDIVPPDSDALDKSSCDYFIFPNIDHSLLGTGIVKAVKQYRARGLTTAARILPAKAAIFAMGIQWAYRSTTLQLQAVNQLRWSIFPPALELPQDSWTALTQCVQVGEIDFENFAEAEWNVRLPIAASGTIDAIVFWFDLSLGDARISTAPSSELRCIKPAVQYTDATPVELGQSLAVRVQVTETRLRFHTQPPTSQLRSNGLPSWYVPMLLDRQRNDAYRASLQRALQHDSQQTVLDIGAGCGLLSMLAAQAGAKHVIGSELSPAICKVGNNVLKANNLDDKVTLISKDCRKLTVPEDFPARADLAVFELFDCSLIGEGVLHFIQYAREHLLKDNARYLPMSATIRGMVIEYRLDRIWDIDANLLNPYRFSPAFINVDANKLRYRALTAPFDVFAFDFSKATPAAAEKRLLMPAAAAGTAGAVLFWFDLQLDETHWICNDPHAQSQSHWKQGLQFLPELQVNATMQLPLIAKHNGSSLTFQWQQTALPKEAFSKLPRFDPRQLAAANELDQQTRGLLQYCTQEPSEFATVAELAKRFAIDPAAHDLDPIIAQRFAATFFGSGTNQ